MFIFVVRRTLASHTHTLIHAHDSMLGFLFGNSASESELDSLKKKCATRESAVKVCLRGNSAAACDNFQQDLDLCKVSRDDDVKVGG